MAQLLGEQPDQLAAARRRHAAPDDKGALGGGDHALEVGRVIPPQRGDLRSVDRRADGKVAARQTIRGDAEFSEECSSLAR